MVINKYICYRSPAAEVLLKHENQIRQVHKHQVRPGNIYTHAARQVCLGYFPVLGYTYPSLSEPNIDTGEHISNKYIYIPRRLYNTKNFLIVV